GQGGPLQNTTNPSVPVSDPVVKSAQLPVFWGNAALQGLHIGFFVALGALVVFWFILNRTTLGYEVRAVGFNPEAARYGGISVAQTVLKPELAGNLTLMIQALVLLFVGADVLIMYVWQARRRVLPRRLKPAPPAVEAG